MREEENVTADSVALKRSLASISHHLLSVNMRVASAEMCKASFVHEVAGNALSCQHSAVKTQMSMGSTCNKT